MVAVEKFDEVQVTSDASKTFCIGNEDHTLGNSLRHVLMQDEHVTFCGYSMPHPSEPKLHLRVQTNGEKGATEVLEKGLETLASVCDHIITVSDDSIKKFKAEVEAGR